MSRWITWTVLGILFLNSNVMAQEGGTASRRVTPPAGALDGEPGHRGSGPTSSPVSGLLALGILVAGGIWYWKERHSAGRLLQSEHPQAGDGTAAERAGHSPHGSAGARRLSASASLMP